MHIEHKKSYKTIVSATYTKLKRPIKQLLKSMEICKEGCSSFKNWIWTFDTCLGFSGKFC